MTPAALIVTVWLLVSTGGTVAPVSFATRDACESIKRFAANPFNFQCLPAEVVK